MTEPSREKTQFEQTELAIYNVPQGDESNLNKLSTLFALGK